MMATQIAERAVVELELAIDRLHIGETWWPRTPLSDRRRLLLEVGAAAAANAEQWVQTAASIKQLPDGSPLLGEEWISGPYAVASYCVALAETLDALDRGADPLAGFATREAPGNRIAIGVLPHGIFDRLLLNGFRAEVWMGPGTDEPTVRAHAGLAQRRPAETGGIGLVLGAGNITSIAPLDALYQLYAFNRVSLLKLNPVTDPLRPVLEQVFAPMIKRGFVQIATGGAKEGAFLTGHPGFRAIHITGSAATHDAIVFGTGDEGAAARGANAPRLQTPIASELGGVSPTIVLPGRWSARDLRFQAEHVATQKLHNDGFNCIASQVVIISSDWAQKDAFLDQLRIALASAPERAAYYPGCGARIRAARSAYPGAERLGHTGERTLITGLDLANAAEAAFGTEYFAPVLGIAELPGTGDRFLGDAVDVANDRLHGTLGANLIAHPKTLGELGARLDERIAELRYGTVAVNAWTGVGYLTPRATWGAFPGHELADIQSGRGVVHNALLLDEPERTVVRGPFRPSPRSLVTGEMAISPKPPWFVTNRTADVTGRGLTSFAARPRWSALPSIFASALRG
jgi:acyl-CoA reductase-like NAD-dependent aldehyde dehydrogenase